MLEQILCHEHLISQKTYSAEEELVHHSRTSSVWPRDYSLQAEKKCVAGQQKEFWLDPAMGKQVVWTINNLRWNAKTNTKYVRCLQNYRAKSAAVLYPFGETKDTAAAHVFHSILPQTTRYCCPSYESTSVAD